MSLNDGEVAALSLRVQGRLDRFRVRLTDSIVSPRDLCRWNEAIHNLQWVLDEIEWSVTESRVHEREAASKVSDIIIIADSLLLGLGPA